MFRKSYVGHISPLTGAPADRVRRAGLKPATVRENLAFWAVYLGGGDDLGSRVEHALAQFSLDALADIPAGYLSAGQKRRLGLARLLVAPRPLWLLDEPTVSLDAASVEMLAATINVHLKSGGMAVIATHVPMALEAAQSIRLGRVEAAA